MCWTYCTEFEQNAAGCPLCECKAPMTCEDCIADNEGNMWDGSYCTTHDIPQEMIIPDLPSWSNCEFYNVYVFHEKLCEQFHSCSECIETEGLPCGW